MWHRSDLKVGLEVGRRTFNVRLKNKQTKKINLVEVSGFMNVKLVNKDLVFSPVDMFIFDIIINIHTEGQIFFALQFGLYFIMFIQSCSYTFVKQEMNTGIMK